METVTFNAGDTIIAEGTEGNTAFLIISGSVEISIQRGANAKILATLNAGEVFGEMCLIEPGPRSATVRAAADTLCLATSYDEFIASCRAAGFSPAIVQEASGISARTFVSKWSSPAYGNAGDQEMVVFGAGDGPHLARATAARRPSRIPATSAGTSGLEARWARTSVLDRELFHAWSHAKNLERITIVNGLVRGQLTRAMRGEDVGTVITKGGAK